MWDGVCSGGMVELDGVYVDERLFFHAEFPCAVCGIKDESRYLVPAESNERDLECHRLFFYHARDDGAGNDGCADGDFHRTPDHARRRRVQLGGMQDIVLMRNSLGRQWSLR